MTAKEDKLKLKMDEDQSIQELKGNIEFAAETKSLLDSMPSNSDGSAIQTLSTSSSSSSGGASAN